jgi:hypothetical protein
MGNSEIPYEQIKIKNQIGEGAYGEVFLGGKIKYFK